MKKSAIILCLLLFCIPNYLLAQTEPYGVPDSLVREYNNMIREIPAYQPRGLPVTEEQLRQVLDKQPSFAVYKDTYIVLGIPMDRRITRETSDAMVQLSVRQRLTKSYLPFNTFAFITYTQKSFWNVFENSCPFRDHNYNPGLGIGKYIIHNNVLKGAMFVQVEHESNGKDSIDSRSWNFLSVSMRYFYNPRVTFSAKLWIPYVDGSNNKDLLDYRGIGTFEIDYLSPSNKWWLSAEFNPRKGFGNVNTTVTAAFRISRNHNQYLYARFWNGVGEGLLDYNKYAMNIRIGFCIKPDFFSIY